MKTIALTANSEDIFGFCGEWVEALVQQDYLCAEQMLYSGINPWSADEIQRAFSTYGEMDGAEEFVVTRFSEASGENPRRWLTDAVDIPSVKRVIHSIWPIEIVWVPSLLDAGDIVGTVRIDYALNGEWSDLSSNFDMVRLREEIVFSLGRVDVL